ncbi:MAG: helix-turn-helix transcriptional regulator [Oscillospiraceae bacterium]|nr:helix-turn-helix transcriptional regulator [Oscillospiraceae bacterium]
MIDCTLLQMLYAVTKIPLQLYESSVCTYTSGGFEPNPASLIIKCAVNSPHSLCYTVVHEHQYYGMVRVGESEDYVLVGPVMSRDCTRNQARKILSDLQQPADRVDELIIWLNSTPLCDLRRFRAMLFYLDYLLNGVSGRDLAFVPYIKGSVDVKEPQPLPDYIEHFNDVLEKELISCVEYGKPELLESMFSKIESTDSDLVPPVAADAIRSMKNIVLFSLGVASRAALKGGLDYDTMTSTTTRYLNQVESLNRQTDLFALFKQMFLEFARRTARARLTLTNTAVVMNISKTALGRIYEKTTPTIIAEVLGMNVTYLCAHFKRETGKTISEYINEIKVTECKRLLETTNLSISQISEQLSFSSQSYLIKIFKKVTGNTPTEYRNNL